MNYDENSDNNLGNELTVGKLITFQLYWNMMNSAYSALISILNSLV